jgi:hypothetical protein
LTGKSAQQIENVVVQSCSHPLRTVPRFSNTQLPDIRCNGLGCGRPTLRADAERNNPLSFKLMSQSNADWIHNPPHLEIFKSKTNWQIFRTSETASLDGCRKIGTDDLGEVPSAFGNSRCSDIDVMDGRAFRFRFSRRPLECRRKKESTLNKRLNWSSLTNASQVMMIGHVTLSDLR